MSTGSPASCLSDWSLHGPTRYVRAWKHSSRATSHPLLHDRMCSVRAWKHSSRATSHGRPRHGHPLLCVLRVTPVVASIATSTSLPNWQRRPNWNWAKDEQLSTPHPNVSRQMFYSFPYANRLFFSACVDIHVRAFRGVEKKTRHH